MYEAKARSVSRIPLDMATFRPYDMILSGPASILDTGKGGDFMSGSKALRRLCLVAMLMSLSIVVGIICKTWLTWGIYYRVTFENFPIIVIGYCFGPLWGLAAGVGADIISCLCSTNPMVNPVITLGAAAVGSLSGLVPMLIGRKKATASSEEASAERKRGLRPAFTLAVAVALAHLIGQWLIKSIGKVTMLGMPKIGMLIGLGITLAVAPVEYFLIRVIFKNKSVSSALRELSDYELY